MMKRPLAAALIALSVPALGGAAYAVTQSVSTRPASEVVIPNGPTTTTAHAAKAKVTHATDDPANHDAKDVNDDRGNDAVKANPPGTVDDHGNDGANHDVNDDRGNDVNEPEPNDVNDDHGNDAVKA